MWNGVRDDCRSVYKLLPINEQHYHKTFYFSRWFEPFTLCWLDKSEEFARTFVEGAYNRDKTDGVRILFLNYSEKNEFCLLENCKPAQPAFRLPSNGSHHFVQKENNRYV